jgi:hypothetical protein
MSFSIDERPTRDPVELDRRLPPEERDKLPALFERRGAP